MRNFDIGENVLIKNHRGGKEKWIPGTIVKKCGQKSYLVKCGGRIRYCHLDHISKMSFNHDKDDYTTQVQEPRVYVPQNPHRPVMNSESPIKAAQFNDKMPNPSSPSVNSDKDGSVTAPTDINPSMDTSNTPTEIPVSSEPLRRSTRVKLKPQRLIDEM